MRGSTPSRLSKLSIASLTPLERQDIVGRDIRYLGRRLHWLAGTLLPLLPLDDAGRPATANLAARDELPPHTAEDGNTTGPILWYVAEVATVVGTI